jgi:hypothetical protein
LFIKEFDLVEPKEMAPLQHLIDKINAQYHPGEVRPSEQTEESDDDDEEEE